MELQSKFYQSASFTKQNDILSNESLLSLSNNMPSLFIYMETIIGFPKANLYLVFFIIIIIILDTQKLWQYSV